MVDNKAVIARAGALALQAAHTKTGTPKGIDPGFVLTRNGFHIRVADHAEYLRSKISLLVERMYASRGLHTDAPQPPTAPTHQTTLVAFKGDHLFGTLTIGIDGMDGLLADTLYRPQIDATRQNGGRVCEVTRLAMDPEHSSPEVMATIFHLGFMIARQLHRMTDSFIEVHPRHSGFYRRMLGYRTAGPERICPRVGAPAVLMHLELDHAEREIDRLAGLSESEERSLYRLFFSPSEQTDVLRRLAA